MVFSGILTKGGGGGKKIKNPPPGGGGAGFLSFCLVPCRDFIETAEQPAFRYAEGAGETDHFIIGDNSKVALDSAQDLLIHVDVHDLKPRGKLILAET